ACDGEPHDCIVGMACSGSDPAPTRRRPGTRHRRRLPGEGGTRMRNDSLVKTWISVVGAVLLLIGLLGFVNNPIVGRPDALFPTGNVHNVVHILTGLIALYVGFVSTGRDQINGVIGFGILYAVIFVVP